MIKLLIKLFLLFSLSLLATNLLAKESIEITNVNMPKVPPVSRTAAIYFTITNNTDTEIRLTNVSTNIAHHAMIHQSQQINGVAKMKHIDELVISANTRFEFSKGGYHIMLMGIDKSLISEPFDVTIEFNDQPAKTFKISN